MKSYNATTGEFSEITDSPVEEVLPSCIDKITFVQAVVSLIPKERQAAMASDPEVLTAIAMLTDVIDMTDELVLQFLEKAELTLDEVRQTIGM